MQPNNAPVLLRESLGGQSRRFEADHAAALLAYPGTVWAAIVDAAPAPVVETQIEHLQAEIAELQAHPEHLDVHGAAN